MTRLQYRAAIILVAALAVPCGISSTALAQQVTEFAPGPIIEDPPGPFEGFSTVPALAPSLVAPANATSTFIVTYNGFTPQAQAAFQAAVDIWASIVVSSVPIRITANWRTDLPANVLGSAGPTYVFRNFPGALYTNTWFPVAIASKLAGTDLAAGVDDITANFNGNFDWYLGTDGLAGARFDLESVVLHELGHGLGFLGSMDGSGGIGSWGTSGNPFVYDLFAVNGSGQSLLNTSMFPNPSAALGAQLVSNNLYYYSSGVVAANGGSAARLYAPATWSPGSSYSHLDDATYPAGNANSLMTHAIGPGEAIHDPGPIVRTIFRDFGLVCSYSLSAMTISTDAAASTQGVNVTTTAGCSWTAVSNASFLAVTSGSSGTGNGTVTFTIGSNSPANTPTSPRFGTLTIAGITVTVNQTGCTFSVGPTSASYDASGGAGSVAVTASSGCNWTAVSNNGFLSVIGGSPGTANGVPSYSVASNVGPPNVVNGGRAGSLTVAGQTVTITQTGCTYSIDPTAATFGASAASAGIAVTTPSVCQWTVSGVPVWASPAGGLSGTGAGTWAYSVQANAGARRNAALSVAGVSFQLTQLATPLKTMTAGRGASFSLADASAEQWASIGAAAGRSFCGQVAAAAVSTDAASPAIDLYEADGVTLIGSSSGAPQICFIASHDAPALFRITQADAAPRLFRMAVVETTLWSNWFFIGGNYSSYTLLRNASSSPVHAVITWRSDTGSVAGTVTVTLGGGGVYYQDARAIVSGASAGSVEVAYDGEPGALVGSQTTLASSTGLSFDTIMMRRK